MNQAFGPGGWGLMPFGSHKIEGGYLCQEYGLFCYGQYVSQAYGEQQFDESKFNSRNLSTALEGAKSNSLMRCCKDLGVASELWDPQFILQWLSKYVVKVMCEHQVSKQKKVLFRRMDRPMFEYPWKEISVMETNTKKKPSTSNSNPVGEQQQEEGEEGPAQMDFEGLDASILNPEEDSNVVLGSSSSNPGILEDEAIEELNIHPSVSRSHQKTPFSSSQQQYSPPIGQQQIQTNVSGSSSGGMISSALFEEEEAKVLSSSSVELDLDAVDMFGSFQQMQEQKQQQQQHNSNIRNSTSATTSTTTTTSNSTGSRRPVSQKSIVDSSTAATTSSNTGNNKVVGGGGTSGFALDKEVRFGKHKGKSWRDVLDEPGIQDYLQWLATKGATPFIRQTGIDALNHLQKANQ